MGAVYIRFQLGKARQFAASTLPGRLHNFDGAIELSRPHAVNAFLLDTHAHTERTKLRRRFIALEERSR
jgi:hypothetical protein